MLDSLAVDLDPEPLRENVHVVILKILRYARRKGGTHHEQDELSDPPKKISRRNLLEFRHILIENLPKDQRVDQREDRINGCKAERQPDKLLITLEIIE